MKKSTIVLKKVNIKVRKLYNLRHTFASQLIGKGEDIIWARGLKVR